jgi:hypothetical protein
MERIKHALGSALVIFVAAPAVLALAPSNGAAQGLARPAGGGWATAGTLAPSEIVIEVRRAGFEPISRPVQRGSVYILFALDDGDMDVKLTVDARSGRVLWVSDVVRQRYSGYYGYPASPRYGRPLAPPAEIPNIGPGRSFRPDRATTFARPSAPLPHTRPADLTSAAPKESPPPAAASLPSPASGGGKGAGNVAAPVRSDVAPAAKSPPVTMVPVAPLE